MDVMDWLLIIRVNYEKAVILITMQKSFFDEQNVLIFSLVKTAFLSSILNWKNAKHLKKYK